MSNTCEHIHKLFNGVKRHYFPFNKDEIPENGIYILFEKGELAHSADRIVRIGTHTGQKQLYSRLNQHFLFENKDRSIFRKNIGRAILNKNNDSFLSQWNEDLTTREKRIKYSKIIDMEKQNKIEKEVTKYIQDNFSFIVFEVDSRDTRLKLESEIISTVSLCTECKQSENWLGNFSPDEKIKKSGLWQVKELWKNPLEKHDIELIEKAIEMKLANLANP